MATSGTPSPAGSLPYQPYRPIAPVATTASKYTSDPRQIASNQANLVSGQGQALMANDENLANQYGQQAAGTQAYLNPIESNLASGGGGYNAAEQSQIQLTPEQQQNIVTGAGISAGAGTASAVGGAERAAAAAGGNPAALATYRARAAQTQGAQAGDAMTQARIGAQQAGAAGAEQVGQARIGQQAQGLGYYGGLQGQQQQASLSEQGLQQGAYGTETSGTGQAAQLGVQASQTPSTLDKVAGGIAGAVSALADGSADYLSDGMDAVLGEDGPEIIVEGASDPVRSHTKFMATGGAPDAPGAPGAPATGTTSGAIPPWMQLILNGNQKMPAASGGTPQQAQWNPTTPWNSLGTAIGGIAKQQMQPSQNGGQTPNQTFAPGSTQMPPAGTTPYSDTNPRQLIDHTGIAGDAAGTMAGGVSDIGDVGASVGDVGGDVAADAAGLYGADGVVTPSLYANGGMAPYRARMMADGAPADGQMRPEDYRREAEASLRREQKNQGPGRGGNNTPDHDTATSLANIVDVPVGGWKARQPGPWRGGYIAPPAAPHMADGGFPADDGLPKAPAFNPGKIITQPTRVHLDKGDQVVPLSYRPKARVRPSAALMPMDSARLAPRLRESYGGVRGA
jgi:hypothetical protein